MYQNSSLPLVSILINNYNYARFLPEAIASALEQTYVNLEIIVVDDGSQDDSLEIILSYGEKIIPILKENGGQASAFNQGFAASRGEIICFLDADDLFTPIKIAKIVEVFQSNPQISWCFHPLKIFSTPNPPRSEISEPAPGSGIYDLTTSIRQGKLRGQLPFAGTATSGICFHRPFLEQLLPMPEEIRITSDDYLKYAALGLKPGYILLEELAWQRLHGNNAYTNRPNQKSLRGKINILTAFWLKNNFPCLAKFANNIIALGYSFYNQQEADADMKIMINQYLSSLNFRELTQIYVRQLYYFLKRQLDPLFQP
jgi:glycosyltransferase involved in cell wall biosynthesis